jgi:hypothetical protein
LTFTVQYATLHLMYFVRTVEKTDYKGEKFGTKKAYDIVDVDDETRSMLGRNLIQAIAQLPTVCSCTDKTKADFICEKLNSNSDETICREREQIVAIILGEADDQTRKGRVCDLLLRSLASEIAGKKLERCGKPVRDYVCRLSTGHQDECV